LTTCEDPECGDGIISAGEECDDDNTSNDDGCDSSCDLECGNGSLDGDEQCDGGAGCSDDC